MTNSQLDVRTCGNCACFARMMPDGSVVSTSEAAQDTASVCRRTPPGGRYERREVPVVRDGAPVIDRGRPRMEARQVLQIGYPPTVDTAVCWDGWRPLGTKPGESAILKRV